jgi:hypothetical protein
LRVEKLYMNLSILDETKPINLYKDMNHASSLLKII